MFVNVRFQVVYSIVVIFVLKTYFVNEGFSSKINARKVCTPLQMEERARLINIKKKKKDQSGGGDIFNTASG